MDRGRGRAVARAVSRWVMAGLATAVLAACAHTSAEIATPGSTGFTPATTAPPSTVSSGDPGPSTSAGSAPTTVSALGPPTVKETSTISTVGLDKVTFGMTKADAEKAAGSELVPEGPGTSACQLVTLRSGAPGVSFLLVDGRVERVDISAPPISTRSGAKVGSSVAQVQALYPGQIADAARPDGQPGGALVFVPKDAADANFRLVFSTDGTTVTSYRAGRLPAVIAPTGCA
jgi:hypothetical protein